MKNIELTHVYLKIHATNPVEFDREVERKLGSLPEKSLI